MDMLRMRILFQAFKLNVIEVDPGILKIEPAEVASWCGGAHVVNAPQSNDGDDSWAEWRVINPATEWKRGEYIYPMERKSRGRCIIINNCEFADPEAHRVGSELDVIRMQRLFGGPFYFDCETYCDLSACEMKMLLSAKAQEELQKTADCLVVVLMSHGDGQGNIYGVDHEKLPLEDVYKQFNNKNCPALQGKPKLFIVQACRGEKPDPGTEEYVPAGPAVATDGVGWVPTWSDVYICYSSVPGCAAFRNPATGTWFLSAVYRVFLKYAYTMHLEELLHRVNQELITRHCDHGCQTPSSESRGWRAKLYFNPGLHSHHTT